MNLFPERLRIARNRKKFTGAELAEKIGLPESSRKQTISNWENSRSEPSLAQITLLAEVLGVSRAWLLGDGDDDTPSAYRVPDGKVLIDAQEAVELYRLKADVASRQRETVSK